VPAVLDDYQVVVDRVAEHDLGLGAGGGEDQVLHLAAHPARAGKADQVVKDAVVVLRGDIAGQGEQLGQLPAPYSPLDVAPLAVPRAFLIVVLGRQAQPNALVCEVVRLDICQRAGDRLAQDFGAEFVG